MITTINRSALVTYSAEAMFSLVADVESYPRFIKGCHKVEVLERNEDYLLMHMELGVGGIRYAFTTRNTMFAPELIVMGLESGPLKKLDGTWRFKPLGEDACKVSLDMEFEVKSRVASVASSNLFSRVANNLVAKVCSRADVLYKEQGE